MEHKGTTELQTKRLILRPWLEGDAGEAFANWMNDPDVTKYMTWTPHGDIAVTRALLRMREEECKRPDCYHWAIVLKEGGVLIGDIEAGIVDEYQATGGIGYCIGKKWWGRGIMTEALTEVLRYCFEDVGFYRINGSHAAENIGFKYEGTRRKAYRLLGTGERVDIVERGILREDYFGSRLLKSNDTPV